MASPPSDASFRFVHSFLADLHPSIPQVTHVVVHPNASAWYLTYYSSRLVATLTGDNALCEWGNTDNCLVCLEAAARQVSRRAGQDLVSPPTPRYPAAGIDLALPKARGGRAQEFLPDAACRPCCVACVGRSPAPMRFSSGRWITYPPHHTCRARR